MIEGLYKRKQQMRKKKRENSAILQHRRKGSKSKSRPNTMRSQNKQDKSQKSYNKFKTLPIQTPEERKTSSIVDDFCKDLYEFMGESKVDSQSTFLVIFSTFSSEQCSS